MAPDVTLLVLTAASIGFVHTVLGPDHYLPFVALAKARAWSARRTAWITGLCSGAHVMSSVLIGAAGIAAGAAIERVLHIESFRGHVAPWLLLGFGLAYAAWGVKRALRGDSHRHEHFHADGTRHSHDHDHRLAPHLHPHGDSPHSGPSSVPAHGAEGDSPLRGQSPVFTIERVAPAATKPLPSITPWALFIVFAFGPCESLIPLLMYPAAEANWLAVAAVCAAFGAATLATMLAIVLLLRRGLEAFDWNGLERWTHAIAGGAIAICAAAILALGHTHAHADGAGHGHAHGPAAEPAAHPAPAVGQRGAAAHSADTLDHGHRDDHGHAHDHGDGHTHSHETISTATFEGGREDEADQAQAQPRGRALAQAGGPRAEAPLPQDRGGAGRARAEARKVDRGLPRSDPDAGFQCPRGHAAQDPRRGDPAEAQAQVQGRVLTRVSTLED